MENLIERLNQNFDVEPCGSFENMLHQQVERVIICDRAYSILQQSDNLFEVVYAEKSKDKEVHLPFDTPTYTFNTVSNLSADEVISLISEVSNKYLINMIKNPLISKHEIRL